MQFPVGQRAAGRKVNRLSTSWLVSWLTALSSGQNTDKAAQREPAAAIPGPDKTVSE
jgi:hypothetical protein